MKAPKANVASVLMPWMAPPKMPCAQLPTLPVRVCLAESIRLGSMSSFCSDSLIQSDRSLDLVLDGRPLVTMPTVMRASSAKPRRR